MTKAITTLLIETHRDAVSVSIFDGGIEAEEFSGFTLEDALSKVAEYIGKKMNLSDYEIK